MSKAKVVDESHKILDILNQQVKQRQSDCTTFEVDSSENTRESNDQNKCDSRLDDEMNGDDDMISHGDGDDDDVSYDETDTVEMEARHTHNNHGIYISTIVWI